MGKAKKTPTTMALRALRGAGADHEVLRYDYVPRGGTAASSAALGEPEHGIIKTLIFETDAKDPVVVLMHGDQEVSTKQLARILGVKLTRPADPKVAQRHSGYLVGGTSPFGLKRAMPVYAQTTIRELDTIIINGGARGLLVRIAPDVLERLLDCHWVDVSA